jgi:hypothetical protein
MASKTPWIFGDLLDWLFPSTYSKDSVQTLALWAVVLLVIIIWWRHVFVHIEG